MAFCGLRTKEGAMKASVKNDTSADNWPMNAQFFFSSFVTLSRDQLDKNPQQGMGLGVLQTICSGCDRSLNV